MELPSEKQIWDEVFDGNVENASELTQAYRNKYQQHTTSAGTNLEPLALYIEPSLASINGHQLTLTDCYKKSLTNLGYHTKIVHSAKHTLPLKEGWLPYFLVKHHTLSSRSIRTITEIESVQCYFLTEFEKIIRLNNPQLCIFATIRFTNVVAATKALIACKIQYAIFGLMEADDVPDCNDSDLVRRAFTQAATILQTQEISHLLIAETDHIKTFLLSCGFRDKNVRVFPYVAAKLITEVSAASSKEPDKIQVGYLGGSRPVRHPELIADLIASEAIPDSVSLSVQLDFNYIKLKRGQKLCDKIIEMDKKGSIKLYPPNLSHQEYRSLFCSLDFIILPYGERYQQIGSGIFFEAIYAEVIPICVVDSKFYEFYTSLGGKSPCMKSLSGGAIRVAIIDGVCRFSTLREATSKLRQEWRKHPSSAEQWQSELADWLPDHSSFT